MLSLSTLRLLPFYETGAYRGSSALIELEAVAAIGSHRYNSPVNGKTSYSVVADPEDTEINRVELAHTGFSQTRLS